MYAHACTGGYWGVITGVQYNRVRQLFVFSKNWVSKSSTMSFFHYERLIVDLLMRKLRYERPVLLTGKAFSGYRQKYRSLIVASTMSQALRSFA